MEGVVPPLRCVLKVRYCKIKSQEVFVITHSSSVEGEWENEGLGRVKKLEIGVRRKSLRNLAGDRIVHAEQFILSMLGIDWKFQGSKV